MNAELTAETRTAFVPPNSVFSSVGGNRTTHEDEGRVQILVVFPRVIPVKLSRFSAVHGEEVGPRVVDPQRIEEFFEGGMEAGSGRQYFSDGLVVTVIRRIERTTSDLSGQLLALASLTDGRLHH